ncbi:MAG: DUF255 domain-containing protein [Planctomycetaceae bacterium]|jgi:uncharacterized protein|nr:DUF255 domain-containing protein [Planctomycetaceae bacterium]
MLINACAKYRLPLVIFSSVFSLLTAVGLAEDSSPKTTSNRLADESSPYLLLHAHNPVNWYPWGPEAFEAAKKENKPIFLSIGYSSCYWCHVMERLVFENKEIAAAMNEQFINIKVDREERPDVDDIYMTSLIVYNQLIGSPSGGGWPLSIFLTPDGKPFAGGTYFPPADTKDGRTGFPTVMERVSGLWQDNEKSIRANADVMTNVVKRQMTPMLDLGSVTLKESNIDRSIQALKESYDPEYGGIDFNTSRPDGPKFPTPSKLSLLMHAARVNQDDEAQQMVLKTLTEIAQGGIRDHLEGGFHRYSTDREWLVPHFEKMLYDQAQLVPMYLSAWELTEDRLYKDAAVETLEFVLTKMTDKTGGFYSAIDAETESVEGKHYVWSKAEIVEALGEKSAEQFFAVYGLNNPNPFEHGYVLHLSQSIKESAEQLGQTESDLRNNLEKWKQQLLTIRNNRKQPLLDDKVLVSWNALMIEAFAKAGRVLEEPRYTAVAVKAAEFIQQNMVDEEGHLLRTARDGKAKLNAYLDDYAFYVSALLELYRSTNDEKWLTAARTWNDRQLDRFWDETSKAFFFTSHDHEKLIAKSKSAYDAVIPSGNSVSAINLLELSRLTGEPKYRQRAEETLKVFAPVYDRSPRSLSILSLAMSKYFLKEEPKTSEFGNQIFLTAGHALMPVAFQEKKHVITFKPYLNVKKLPPGKTALVAIVINVEEGWHINTNPAQPDFFIPTEFKIESDDGITLKAAKYPKGKSFELEGFDDPLMVYEGQVVIYGQITIPNNLAGKSVKVRMNVKYQACNDKMCKPPATTGGTLTLEVAKSGEPIKSANEKYFPKGR